MSKGFASGIIAGAVIGATIGMLVDPMNDKQHKKFKEIAITDAGCTVACHCGEDTLGILFVRK